MRWVYVLLFWGFQVQARPRIRNHYGFSFLPAPAWRVKGYEGHLASAPGVIVKADGGWRLEVDYTASEIHSQENLRLVKKDRSVVFDESVKVDGHRTYLYEEVDPETNPFIDQRAQSNYRWGGRIDCPDGEFDVNYTDFLNHGERARARRVHILPAPLKELLESFRCEPPSPHVSN